MFNGCNEIAPLNGSAICKFCKYCLMRCNAGNVQNMQICTVACKYLHKPNKMKKITVILGLFALAFSFSACKDKTDDTTQASYPVSVRMTDAPGPYDAVYVDVIGVEITGGNGKNVLMNVNPGIYNLLNFTNGLDTLIATSVLSDSRINQIRLILGSNNSVVLDSVTYPLSTPSAEQSGLKLNVNYTLQAGVMYAILLDFDANKSIVDKGNGVYSLKPVIRTVEKAITGAIKGSIVPAGINAVITATSSSNETYTTQVSVSGGFMLMGIPAGVYTIAITPDAPYAVKTITGVTVNTGSNTDLGSITL